MHLTTDEETTVDRLQTLEPESEWFAEFAREVRRPIADDDTRGESLDLQWRSVLDTGLNPSPELSDLSLSLALAEQFRTKFQDLTLTAMLAPLQGQSRDQVVELRRQVQRAVEASEQQQFDESIRLLEPLRAAAEDIDSEFDRLWIDLNRAEAMIWLPNLTEARQILVVPVKQTVTYQDFAGRAGL